MSIGFAVHLLAGLLLVSMASFALIEARSSSLIPKSLFLWPFSGLLFGILTALAAFRMKNPALPALGIVMILCSLQAFLVNIRKLSRWPSGAVWLLLVLVCLIHQIPYSGAEEPLFRTFLRRFSGFLWAAVGITKVLSEKTVSQEGAVPPWILLLYGQAILIASFPS